MKKTLKIVGIILVVILALMVIIPILFKGEIEELVKEEANKKALADRTFIDQIIGKPVEPYIAVCKIAHGEAHFWTLNDILKERELERVKF